MKGRFKAKNPAKYDGNPSNIIYRSSWELKVMMDLDHDQTVIKWSSEEVIVGYWSPVDKKAHRYFPDFVITRLNKDGTREKVMIEVKPKKETAPPVKPKRMTKRYINEVLTYEKNCAKWNAAIEYCASRKWKFSILTEDDLFGKK
jgi:hypothetical protein